MCFGFQGIKLQLFCQTHARFVTFSFKNTHFCDLRGIFPANILLFADSRHHPIHNSGTLLNFMPAAMSNVKRSRLHRSATAYPGNWHYYTLTWRKHHEIEMQRFAIDSTFLLSWKRNFSHLLFYYSENRIYLCQRIVMDWYMRHSLLSTPLHPHII